MRMNNRYSAAIAAGKRNRVISSEECKHDLADILPLIFKAHHEALLSFNRGMQQTPPQCRVRGLEASYFLSKTIQSLGEIGLDVRLGKFGRRLLYINGYIILFKKFDGRGRPMNIKTKHNTAIENQQVGDLFGCGEDDTAPILYFGYSVSRFGEVCSPRLAYIDEGRLKWVIAEDDLAIAKHTTEITPKQPAGGVFVKSGAKTAKKAE